MFLMDQRSPGPPEPDEPLVSVEVVPSECVVTVVVVPSAFIVVVEEVFVVVVLASSP